MSIKTDLLETTQTRLQNLGWYAGKVDGIEGPLTEQAIVDFKDHHGLRARPYIGPITSIRLWADSAEKRPVVKPNIVSGKLPWLIEARRLQGTKEAPGAANNPVIMDWADNLDQWYPGDDIAWCGLYVAWCMAVGAPHDPQEFNRLGAREWGKYGRQCEPQLGAIMTFWRGSRSGWQGHVGFYVGETATTYHILGGNQSNSVNVMAIAKDRFLEARWPKSFSDDGERVITDNEIELSTNEA